MSTIEEQEYRKSLCLHGIPRAECRICELEDKLKIARGQVNAFVCQQNENLAKLRLALGEPEGEFRDLILYATAKVRSLRLAEAEIRRLSGVIEKHSLWEESATTRAEADADLG